MIEYETKVNKRTKRISVRVYPDGRVAVTSPRKLLIPAADAFVRQKSAWIEKTREWFRTHPQPARAKHSTKEIAQYKKEALQLVQNRLEYFNEAYNFRYAKISIRNQKTRWGSCSRSGNLSFNYRIALLPASLADYVIVHELCHLREMNHSAKFWKLVTQAVPDWKERRKELRTHQRIL